MVGAGDADVNCTVGMGAREATLHFTDAAPTASTWYYVRLIQVDGEAAWSSPVFVEPASR